MSKPISTEAEPAGFHEAKLPGVLIKRLLQYTDARGWLVELFRADEVPPGCEPAMCYLSSTCAGTIRGPHEHRDQTDMFCFLSGEFELTLWENRPNLPRQRLTLSVGSRSPVAVIVPPGVVHAYRNIGDGDALVLNFPNRLYGGAGRRQPVDEIRHEEKDSEFTLT